MALDPVHNGHLPVWSEGNLYIGGAKAWKKDVNSKTIDKDIRVELVEKEDGYYLDTNITELIGDFTGKMINTQVLGKAFEPEQFFENPDGTPICFDSDYFGGHRGVCVIPGPFAGLSDYEKEITP